MRTIAFLHEQTLYFVVASPVGCVDFSIKQESVNVSIKGSHLARDAWILATYFTNVNGKIAVASRKGCVDFSNFIYSKNGYAGGSHLARDAWILAANYSSGVP